jgi:uncharacterized caspase-like protein
VPATSENSLSIEFFGKIRFGRPFHSGTPRSQSRDFLRGAHPFSSIRGDGMASIRPAVKFRLRAFLIALTLATLPFVCQPLFAAEANPGRKLALLVGVKEYDHAQLNNLQFPENDVEELGEVLSRQGFQVIVLTTVRGKRDANFEPTAENFKRQLSRMLTKVTKNDLALVGLAGHGLQPLGSDKAYFCPKDANPAIRDGAEKQPSYVAFPEKLVSIDDVLTTLDESGVGQKLLLVDACRNDPHVRGRRGVDRVKVSALPPETGVLLSCSSGQFAFEHQSFGKGGHGAFFAAVLAGLRGGAAERTNVVTWESLGLYVRRQVPAMVEQVFGKDGGLQRPNLIANISAEPAVLATVIPANPGKSTPLRERYTFTPPPPQMRNTNTSANAPPPVTRSQNAVPNPRPAFRPLRIDVSGVNNNIELRLAGNGDEPESGTRSFSGTNGNHEILIAPGQRIFLDVSGVNNNVYYPRALKRNIQVDSSGINNEIIAR